MLWFALVAVAAIAVVAVAKSWRTKEGYVEQVVPFKWSAEQVEAARRLMEREYPAPAKGRKADKAKKYS